VYERVPGVFSQGQATVLGSRLVDASPAQTFRLEKVAQAPSGGEEPTRAQVARALRDFRGGGEKGGGFKYRERQRALINSGGELVGITYKGVAASAKARRRGFL
jgi:hypothetical protein